MPTRGTTPEQRCSGPHVYFNPRAHEGHDSVSRTGSGNRDDFNPRAHEGHDAAAAEQGISLLISIHVPTRGTTMVRSALIARIKFQSTCPRGARRTHAHVHGYPLNFNPRAHEGHDNLRPYICERKFISIHVPTRGTTRQQPHQHPRTHFNPRAHEGHDLGILLFIFTFDISIHVPTRGTTLPAPERTSTIRFQSTCPRGARLCQNVCVW